MTERTKRLVLAIATLPSVAFPFLVFCCVMIRPYDVVFSMASLDWSSVMMELYVSVAFAPLAIMLLDAWRLLGRGEAHIVAWGVGGYGVLPWLASMIWLAWLTGAGLDPDGSVPSLSDYVF